MAHRDGTRGAGAIVRRGRPTGSPPSRRDAASRGPPPPRHPVAHEKPPSLAGFDGLRSSRLAPPPLPFGLPFVMPGHSAGLLCCAFAGAYPVGSNDLKPSKPASGSVFSCARRRSRASEGDFPRVRCRFEQTKRGSRAADGVDGERRQQARSEIPRPRGARRARRGRRLAITQLLLRPFRAARRAPAAGPQAPSDAQPQRRNLEDRLPSTARPSWRGPGHRRPSRRTCPADSDRAPPARSCRRCRRTRSRAA